MPPARQRRSRRSGQESKTEKRKLLPQRSDLCATFSPSCLILSVAQMAEIQAGRRTPPVRIGANATLNESDQRERNTAAGRIKVLGK